MPSYPARKISTPDDTLNVLQITDLHLSDVSATANTEVQNTASKSHLTCKQSFEAVVKQALGEAIRCDLIVVTGDLVSEVKTATYDHIFDVLQATDIPFACIAGNHDVTNELGHDLPFYERKLIAQPADPRLLSRHLIESEYWQLLLLDSSVPGQVAGYIDDTDIAWVSEQLARCSKPAVIAVHHHVLPIQSQWIDAHMAQNTKAFWDSLAAFRHIQAVISGHNHQEQIRYHQEVTVYSTPSTCYQFKPFNDDFAYDTQTMPGYRWLQLDNNGRLVSWVKRLDT
ncbi:metallophosphoesterase [Psychrobacter sp. DM8]